MFFFIQDICGMKVGEEMTKKIIINIMIFILISINYNIYAWDVTDADIDEPIDSTTGGGKFKPDSWKPSSTNSVSNGDELETVGNKVIGSVKVVGTIMSVITLIIMGIRYALGSLEEKAEYKKTMKPYIIGAVMVFAITNILGIIQDILGGL